MSYKKFSVMMIISFIIMYCVMFLNITQLDYFYVSTTRIYMALLMISPIIFIITLAGLRTQTPIGDVQYMKAMIPHHSSAILTSENANIKDPEVRKLADGIIEAQKREIAEMKALIQKLRK